MNFKMYINKFKELWAVPRYRSIIKLGLWIIFFILVSLGVSSYEYVGKDNHSNDNNDEEIIEEKEAIEKFKDMDNYSFTINYIGKENTVIIGKNYNNKSIIMFNDKMYYREGDIVYNIEGEYRSSEEIDSPFPSSDFSLQPSDLYTLIKRGTLDEETKKIQDNTIIKKYIIIDQLVLLKYQIPEGEKNKASIIITTYEKDGQINKVDVDLTNIKKIEEAYDGNEYIITIDYSDIDKVLEFVYKEKIENAE